MLTHILQVKTVASAAQVLHVDEIKARPAVGVDQYAKLSFCRRLPAIGGLKGSIRRKRDQTTPQGTTPGQRERDNLMTMRFQRLGISPFSLTGVLRQNGNFVSTGR
jgi:hypothetical protein